MWGSPQVAKGSGSATKVGRSHPGPYLLKGSPGLLHRGHVPKLLAALAAPPPTQGGAGKPLSEEMQLEAPGPMQFLLGGPKSLTAPPNPTGSQADPREWGTVQAEAAGGRGLFPVV